MYHWNVIVKFNALDKNGKKVTKTKNYIDFSTNGESVLSKFRRILTKKEKELSNFKYKIHGPFDTYLDAKNLYIKKEK